MLDVERADREISPDLIVDAENSLGRKQWYLCCHSCCLRRSSQRNLKRGKIWKIMAI